jgi:hypothetical protein
LAVLLVIGMGSVASGSNGDPLIMGQDNSAIGVTSVSSEIDLRTPTLGSVITHCAGLVRGYAGSRRVSVLNPSCYHLGELVATLNTRIRGVWVQSVSVCNCNGQSRVIIRFNKPLPREALVSYLAFRGLGG